MAISVLIADDQIIVRSGLRMLVESCGGFTVVAEAADGAQAVAECRRHRPDIVLMDLTMPYVDGITATARLRAADEPPTVLMLAEDGGDSRVFDAFEAGASGFLLKELCPQELRAALASAAAGSTVVSPAVLSCMMRRVSRTDSAFFAHGLVRLPELTDSEQNVLTLLGAGLSNVDIARKLHLSTASVKTYVSRLLHKLGLANRTQAAIFAYEAGLVGQPETTAVEYAVA